MGQTIVVPSGDRLEFPDGMADADIEKAIFAEYPDMAPKKGAMSRIGDAMKPAEREPMPSAADMINAPWTSSFVPQDETINLPGSVMDKFRQPAQKEQAMPIESGMGPMRKDFYDTTRSQIMAAPAQQHEALAVAEGQVGKVAAATLPERQARADRLAAGDMQPRSMQELSDQTEADLRQPRAMFDARQQANREWLQENSKAVAKSIQKNTGLSDEDADAEVERMARAGYKPDWLMDDMPTATLAQAISANVGATWPALQKSLLGLAEFAPNLPVPFVEYSRRTPKQLEMAVSSLDRQIRQARNVGGVIKSGSWNDVVASMGPSLALNLPPLVAGALASSVSPAAGMAIVNGGLGVMGLSAFGDAYLKGQQKGLQSGDNLMQASLSAAAEVIPEKLSLNALFAAFKTLGKGSAIETVKSFLKQQLTEHTTEQITTISHHLIDKAYTEPNKPIEQLWDEVKQTAMATAIQAPLLAGAGTGAYVAGRAGAKAIDNIAASRDLTYGREFDQDQIDAAVRQSLSPDAAQLRRVSPVPTTPPVPPAPSARAELEAVLNDKRPVEEILAETQNQQAEASGWPALNTPVVAKLPDGQVIAGQIQRVDNGAARFVARDGEVWVFNPGEAEITAASGDGTRAAPVKAETADDVKLAEQAVDTAPTEAQKQAGNYRLGHLQLQGMDIAIETPAGATRAGVDRAGKPWSVTMTHTYGYIKGAEAKDGDKLDAFIGPNPQSQAVYVIDQIDPKTGNYDEAKVMLGFDSADEARAAYLSNYEQGWQGLGAITPMHVDAFKAWIAKGDTRKALAYTKPAAPVQTADTLPRSPQPEPEAAGLKSIGQTNAQAREVSRPEITLTIDDVPPARMKKIKVEVDAMVGDQVSRIEVSANQALSDIDQEIKAYEMLLDCVKRAA